MKKNRRIGSRLIMGLVFLFLYAPILLLIIFSFNSGDSSMVWKGFSLHWYKELFQNRIIMESVYTTLLVSLRGRHLLRHWSVQYEPPLAQPPADDQ